MPTYEYNRDTKELKEIRFAGNPIDNLAYSQGYIQGYKDDTHVSVEFVYNPCGRENPRF